MRKLALALSATLLAVSGTAFAQAPTGPQGRWSDRQKQGPITREQAASLADQIFAKLDVNGDGKLDKADRTARRDRLFAKLDTDNNGAISRAEFDAAAGKLRARLADRGKRGLGQGFAGRKFGGHRIGRGSHRELAMQTRPGAGIAMMARMADTNNDGAISKDEFKTAVLAMFDRADANGDGIVTPDERRQMRHAHRGPHRFERNGGAPADE